MRLLAIVPSPRDINPGQRFRIEQWEPHLQRMGVEVTYEAFESERLRSILYEPGRPVRKMLLAAGSSARRCRSLMRASRFDLVYVFRESMPMGPALFERCLAGLKLPFVYDFDDAIYLPNASPANAWMARMKSPRKTGTICRLASHVMVGNQVLARFARRFSDRVTVVPTTIDICRFANGHRPVNPVPVIGWTGSHTTLPYLDGIHGALRKLSRARQFRFRIIGAANYGLEGVDVECVPWQATTEVDDLRGIDIGVMPLPDTEWTRGKCGLKALQYMALGIPAVCSPVGVNTEIVQHGVNGLLASTEDEWVDRLTGLLDCVDLRRRLGAAGRSTVERWYAADVQAPRVFDILTSVSCAR
jgi:glycosyltransferase involved in cell wall biosynthesis